MYARYVLTRRANCRLAYASGYLLPLLPLFLLALLAYTPAPACCPAGPKGKPVVNADQTVVIIWDAAKKTQHFIRQASFKSEAADFGFLIPTPSAPELEESGNEAFPFLAKVTAPEIKKVKTPNPGMSCGCAAAPPRAGNDVAKAEVEVLTEKRVAGFDAAVLDATSAEALVAWLEEHGYHFSPEVEKWAEPYITQNWKITALKVAKDASAEDEQRLNSAALRLSFETDRPLFPYREPDPKESAAALAASQRLLRIFFVADERYEGQLTAEFPWTGTVAWSDKLSASDRTQLLEALKLPESTGPAEFWLTEFEDDWPYRAAPADVYFSRSAVQDTVKRPPIIQYVDSRSGSSATLAALAIAVVIPFATRRWRKRGAGP
jgi:hypothetical protein